eukprot:EG_transcript_47123
MCIPSADLPLSLPFALASGAHAFHPALYSPPSPSLGQGDGACNPQGVWHGREGVKGDTGHWSMLGRCRSFSIQLSLSSLRQTEGYGIVADFSQNAFSAYF